MTPPAALDATAPSPVPLSRRPRTLSRRHLWRPGRDARAVRHAAVPGRSRDRAGAEPVVVAGGGIAGIAAAVGLAERGVAVVLVEPEAELGGRVRAWPVADGGPAGSGLTMSRGFHAFFRQYYNLRALLRRADPGLDGLAPIEDYPLVSADGPADSFTAIPRTPPLNMAAFVARSPSFRLGDLARVDVGAAMELLDVSFPEDVLRLRRGECGPLPGPVELPARGQAPGPGGVRPAASSPTPTTSLPASWSGCSTPTSSGRRRACCSTCPATIIRPHLWGPLADLPGPAGRTGADRCGGERPGPVRGRPGPGHAGLRRRDGRRRRGRTPPARRPPGSCWPGAGVTDLSWGPAGDGPADRAPVRGSGGCGLDTLVAPERAPFLGTSGYGPLDNVSVLERFEDGARRWSQAHGGSVVELHAYALDAPVDEPGVQGAAADRAAPDLSRNWAGATVHHSEWLVGRDCPLSAPTPWHDRLTVDTPDPRLVLAGDGIRCDFPVALMERAATTGFLAAQPTAGRAWTLRPRPVDRADATPPPGGPTAAPAAGPGELTTSHPAIPRVER